MVDNIIPVTDVLQRLWIGTCTVYEYQEVVDPDTFQTTMGLVPVVEDEPCRLSYSTQKPTELESGIAGLEQQIKLFLSPAIQVSPGSVLEVTQHNRTNRYRRSAEPAVYTNHQEITLEMEKDV